MRLLIYAVYEWRGWKAAEKFLPASKYSDGSHIAGSFFSNFFWKAGFATILFSTGLVEKVCITPKNGKIAQQIADFSYIDHGIGNAITAYFS